MNLGRAVRVLIVCEATLVVLSIAQVWLGRSLLPPELQAYERAQADRDLSTADLVIAGFAVPALVLLLLSWIGLWRLWPRARAMYTAAWALSLTLAAFMGTTVWSWLGQLLGNLGVLVAGMVLGIIYFSELRHSFGTGRAPNTVGAA